MYWAQNEVHQESTNVTHCLSGALLEGWPGVAPSMNPTGAQVKWCQWNQKSWWDLQESFEGLPWTAGRLSLSNWVDTSLCSQSALLHTAALPPWAKGKQTGKNSDFCLCPYSLASAYILAFRDGNSLILSLIYGNCLHPSFHIHFISRVFHGLAWSISGLTPKGSTVLKVRFT